MTEKLKNLKFSLIENPPNPKAVITKIYKPLKTLKDLVKEWMKDEMKFNHGHPLFMSEHGKYRNLIPYKNCHYCQDNFFLIDLREEAIKWIKKIIKDMRLRVDYIPECFLNSLGDEPIGFKFHNLDSSVTKEQQCSYQEVSLWMCFFNISEKDLK